jgi:hypothetical protein
MLCPLAVYEIHTLCLGELVNFTSGETGEGFLGKCVLNWLACCIISVFVLSGVKADSCVMKGEVD